MNPNANQAGHGHWHCWIGPKELMKDDAYRHFLKHIRPTGYDFDKFQYNPKTGVIMTA